VLDLVAAVLAFFAVRVADQPPDFEHHYGHGKVENLTALAETGLLLATCAWIAYEAVNRLFFDPVLIEGDLWAIGVMLLSIVVSLALSTYLMNVARRHRSQSLEATAVNFRTDVLSSLVVLVGLVLVGISGRLGSEWAWMQQADAVAALAVVLLVLRVSLRLGWESLNELLDAAPPGLTSRIKAEIAEVPGVLTVASVRVRRSGAHTFSDLIVSVDRSASLQEAHDIATAVEARVGSVVPGSDVVVHVDPVRRRGESLPQAVSAVAARLGLGTHNVHAHIVRDHYFVDLDVEVPPEMTLAEAHELASRLEAQVHQELPYIDEIHTHLEPLAGLEAAAVLEPELLEELQSRIAQAVNAIPGLSGCHNVHLRPVGAIHDVVLHCRADSGLTVEEAHRLADQAEWAVKAEIPNAGQVLVHVEPASQP